MPASILEYRSQPRGRSGGLVEIRGLDFRRGGVAEPVHLVSLRRPDNPTLASLHRDRLNSELRVSLTGPGCGDGLADDVYLRGNHPAPVPNRPKSKHGLRTVSSRMPSGPGKEHAVPMYKLVTEDGTWLMDERRNGFDWRPGDRIYRGAGDTLEVVEVRDEAGDEKPVLVVRSSVAWVERLQRGSGPVHAGTKLELAPTLHPPSRRSVTKPAMRDT